MSPATPSATDVVAVPAETTEPTEPSAPVAPVTSSTTLSASAAAPAGVVVPKPEYPRPDRDRSAAWLTLNGPWDFESEYGTTTITVPFAWETEASGVQRTWLERGTYRRSVTVPAEWDGSRVLLCFGAVHHRARVLVDDVEVGVHVGGYTSFELDVTGLAAPGEQVVLTVEVEAPADKRSIPHGKQRSVPRDDYDGVSFTPTSGIWQSVWLEARGRSYVAELALRGDSLTGIDVVGTVVGDAPTTPVHVRLVDEAGTSADGSSGADRSSAAALVLEPDATGRFAGRLELTDPHLWSPDDPHLYRVELTTGTAEGAAADRVVATTGLRRIAVEGDHITLNGDRLYVRGVLDQGYWARTGLTAPDDDALVRDLELARRYGYNLVRKHIKLEEPRWLHHADRLGMLVWSEPPAPSRYSLEAAGAFEAQLPDLVERDGSHPSIVVWGLYNEEWGLDWDIPGSPERAEAAAHAYDVMRLLDATRPIVENSGWSHVRTDLVDWHYYDVDPAAWAANVAALADGGREDFPVMLGPDFTVDKSLYGSPDHPRTGIPLLNSEYGAGFTNLERAWHLRWQTQELRRHDPYAGYVYTELTDVEHEAAGLVDADRREKDRGGLDPADVNATTVLVLDVVPAAAGADVPVPTQPWDLVVRVSHHGPTAVHGRVRAAWVSAGAAFGASPVAPAAESAPVSAEPFLLSGPTTVRVPAPGPVPSARLHVWLVDDAGAVLARTFVDAGPVEPPNRRGARTTAID